MNASRLILLSLVLTAAPHAPAQETVQKEVLPAPADPSLPSYRPVPDLSGTLSSVGTDTMDDLMQPWVKAFTALYPGVKIDIVSKASMSVPAALTSGAAQLSPLSRELNPAEIAAFKATHGYAPTEIRVALGSYRVPTRTVALTFYVNEQNPLARLDLSQLEAIWCTSHNRGYRTSEDVIRWGQLGLTGEWADRPIHLVGVEPPDGVPNFVSRTVCKGGPFREGIHTQKNGGPTSVLTRIVQDVADDPNAIGYAGFHNRLPGTKHIPIAETPAGPYFEGTFEEVRTARYPLTRFVSIYVDRQPGKPMNEATRQFLTFILSLEGQRIVEQEGIFMPLPKSIANAQLALLR